MGFGGAGLDGGSSGPTTLLEKLEGGLTNSIYTLGIRARKGRIDEPHFSLWRRRSLPPLSCLVLVALVAVASGWWWRSAG
jgi:hypothetical protein